MQYEHLRRNRIWMMTCDTCSLFLEVNPNFFMASDVHCLHPNNPSAMTDNNRKLDSPHLVSSGKRAVAEQKGLRDADLNVQAEQHLVPSITCTSDGDSNPSNASIDTTLLRLQARNREHGLLSPASECTHLPVTRAGSESSIGDYDGDDRYASVGVWCEQDLSLLAEVLAAECTLLEVQNELDSRISNAERVKMAKLVSMQQPACSCALEDENVGHPRGSNICVCDLMDDKPRVTPAFEDIKEITCCKNIVQSEGQSSPCHTSSDGTSRGLNEDSTYTMQGSLHELFAVSQTSDLVQGQEKDVHASLQAASANMSDGSDWFKEDGVMGVLASVSMKHSSEDKGGASEVDVLQKELSLMSLELVEVKEALASQKREAHCGSRRQNQQTVAEEMYCKETIQRLIQEIQVEIEQWSQMQDLLYILQEEFNGLSETKRLWEERAHRAERKILSLQEKLREWRCRAQSAQEELVMLRCERQILKNRIEMMEEAQMSMSVGSSCQRQELQPIRHVNMGTQHEEFAACESFVHSRNESSRSSVDLGISSQRSFRKSIKKSTSLANKKENIVTNKPWIGELGKENIATNKLGISECRAVTRRAEPIVKLSCEKADVGSKGELKNPVPLAHFVNVSITTNLQSFEHLHGQERKKARLFAFKDKLVSASNAGSTAFDSENRKGGPRQGHANGTRPVETNQLWASKPKSTLPSAPNSTPSRVLFGNIVNITTH